MTAAAALAAFGLGHLGSLAPAFDLIAQFSAHWLIIAAAAAAASFVPQRSLAVLCLGLFGACLLPVIITMTYTARTGPGHENTVLSLAPAIMGTPARASTQQPNDREPASLRLLSFNTWNFNNDTGRLATEILAHAADVLILIEFGPNKAALKQVLARHYPYEKTCERDWNCAIGLMSRWPLRNAGLVDADDDAGPLRVWAEIDFHGRPLTIVGTHVLSPNHGPRANFVELDYLAREMRARKTPVVLAGDLNTTVWAHAFDNFRTTSRLDHMGHLIPTWPAVPVRAPQLGIDHVFASPELRVDQIVATNPAGSDHIGLVATIAWR